MNQGLCPADGGFPMNIRMLTRSPRVPRGACAVRPDRAERLPRRRRR